MIFVCLVLNFLIQYVDDPKPHITNIYKSVLDYFHNFNTVLVNPANNVDNFKALFKMSRKTFNHIRSLVKDHMMSLPRSYRFQDRKEVSLNDQIAIALRRLSSVDPTINIADLFGTNELNVLDITWRFVEALKACGRDHISWPRDMATIKSNFEKAGGMPNCCGAIETAYLKMYPHDSEGDTTVWLDSEKKDSMILQVIVDHKLRFVDVVTGWPGSMTKEDILVRSQIYKLVQNRERLDVLCEGTQLREYLVGGLGFLPWLMTPYKKKEMSEDETEFNKKHSATRLIVNRALNKLKNIWAVIDGGMWRPGRNKLPIIILACCLLHNINVINMEGDGTSDDLMVSIIQGEVSRRTKLLWMPETNCVSTWLGNFLDQMEGDGTSDDLTVSSEPDPMHHPERSESQDKVVVDARDKLCLYLAGKLP